MNKLTSRIIALALCILFLFTAGCNITNNSENSESETKTQEQEAQTELETNELGLGIDESKSDRFYRDSIPAQSYEEALDRASRGELSGSNEVPDQAPMISEYRPCIDGLYVKNTDSYYVDNNTYVVVDAYGNEVLRVYRGGGYITLEEVEDASTIVSSAADPDANIIFGVTFDDTLEDELIVTVIATGFGTDVNGFPNKAGAAASVVPSVEQDVVSVSSTDDDDIDGILNLFKNR